MSCAEARSQRHQSHDESRASALESHEGPLGTVIKRRHNEKASELPVVVSGVGEKSVHSGAVTRIGGDLVCDSKVGNNTWDWAAVNALVRLTKGNVNAAHTSRKHQGSLQP